MKIKRQNVEKLYSRNKRVIEIGFRKNVPHPGALPIVKNGQFFSYDV
jgi:hypothetical protein